ncbi:unnamed protein product [Cuscuta epithymum]|uniref:Uncharacterized protein n=1 Tax=Cuscuta epithymum TaxID=186058 RepID=A0AAV0E2S4_9ASTE|nr:unnamed protein product [Cuscuta epithymum]
MHNTGHGNFIIWDKECIEILGKASASLKVEVEQKTGDPTRFSKDIESLVDKKGIFKIQLRKKKAEENAYSDGISLGVVSIIRDTNVLAMYEQKEHLEINECDERTPEKIDSNANLGETSNREKSIVTKGKGKRISAEKEISAPIELPDSPTASTQREVNVELNGEIKRNLNDEFSSSENGKKLKIKIKQEPL